MGLASTIIWIVLLLTAIFALVIVISARMLDFGNRVFDSRFAVRDRMRGRMVEKGKSSLRRDEMKSIASEVLASSLSFAEIADDSGIEKLAEMEDEEEMDIAPSEEMMKKEERPEPISAPSPAPSTQAPPSKAKRKGKQKALAPPPPAKKEASSAFKTRSGKKSDEFSIKDVDVMDIDDLLDDLEGKIEDTSEGMSRDVSALLPKNMCLKEIFRLQVLIKKSALYSSDVSVNELKLNSKEAEYYSSIKTKLGQKFLESTTRLDKLKVGKLTIRPIAIGAYAKVQPGSRTILFDEETEEYKVEFFITPSEWAGKKINTLRLEFEQDSLILKIIDIPVKIFKGKYEALFGLNISLWQKYAMAIYSAIGALLGIVGSIVSRLGTSPAWLQWLNF